jgi:hypothetical protein
MTEGAWQPKLRGTELYSWIGVGHKKVAAKAEDKTSGHLPMRLSCIMMGGARWKTNGLQL